MFKSFVKKKVMTSLNDVNDYYICIYHLQMVFLIEMKNKI